MTQRIAAVVLAGGRSSRFGRDKLAEPIDGKPMLEVVIDSLRPIHADIIVVAAEDTPPALPRDVKLAVDRVEFEGPLSGLASGLAELDPTVNQVIVVGGDMPSLVAAVLRRLLFELATHEAAVLADDAGPRPLPMAIRPSVAAPAAERLLAAGERRLRALLAELDVAVVPAADWRREDLDAATLRDVDTPADLP